MNDPQLCKPITRKQLTLDVPKIDDTSKETEWVNLAMEQIALEQKEFGFLVEEDYCYDFKRLRQSSTVIGSKV